jgi:hypothetical protein
LRRPVFRPLARLRHSQPPPALRSMPGSASTVNRYVTPCGVHHAAGATFNHPMEDDSDKRDPYNEICAHLLRRAQPRDQPDTGSNLNATVLSRCQNLQEMSRWCDQSIHDAGHSDGPNGPLLVAILFGTRVAETILASVHVRAHQQAGHMDASDLIKLLRNPLAGRGPSTYGSGSGFRCFVH